MHIKAARFAPHRRRALLREPLTVRREALHSALNIQPGVLELATAKVRGLGGAGLAVVAGLAGPQHAWSSAGLCVRAYWMFAAGWAVRSLQPVLHTVLTPTPRQPLSCSCTATLLLQTSKDVEELQTFLDEAVAAGTEGLIVKTLAGGRGRARGQWGGSSCSCVCAGMLGITCGRLPSPPLAMHRTPLSQPPCPTSAHPMRPRPPTAPDRLVRAQQALLALAEAEEGLHGGGGRHL